MLRSMWIITLAAGHGAAFRRSQVHKAPVLMAAIIALSLAFALFAAPGPAFAGPLEPVLRIAVQADSPLKITYYYSKLSTSESRYYTYGDGGPLQNVEIENVSGRKVVAYQLAFFAFDVWNDSVGDRYSSGYFPGDYRSMPQPTLSNAVEALAPRGKVERLIGLDFANPELFLTGLVGVSKVRFEDGEVWSAAPQTWLSQIEDLIPGVSKVPERSA